MSDEMNTNGPARRLVERFIQSSLSLRRNMYGESQYEMWRETIDEYRAEADAHDAHYKILLSLAREIVSDENMPGSEFQIARRLRKAVALAIAALKAVEGQTDSDE